MPTVFEAAETGNIKSLKKLKKEGSNFNEKDSNGNTPLLKASCNGHLETVKWLLLDGGAQITEKNKAGNTALLLAATFGHLDTVIWLLSQEGGAEISETNMLGNTSILMAAYHGQISVVDYLIRYFYTSLDFNDAEKKKFDSFSKNLAIRYYLDVFKLLSQETVDYTELTSRLSKASQSLKNNELSFIYLICFWMQVKYKTNLSSSFDEIMTKESCILKLPPSQQGELISYMFRESYVLDNCFISQDKLVITGISLDESQTKVIEQLLKQHENDSCFTSTNSITEKKQLYADYYLKPVYSTLIQAYRSSLVSSEENAIEKALVDPYTYHFDPYGYYSNTTKELIAENDIAKWTAYHLCQRAETTVQQHRNAYVRTVGTSRISYYETVHKYLNDDNVQKKTLLFQLGDIPASDGERLHWIKEYPNWLQVMSQALAAQGPGQQRLRLIGLESPILLSDTLSKQLWSSAKHEPMPLTLPGNHPVYRLALSEQQAIYCKLYPGLPGINDALHYLYRRVFSSVGGLPWSVAGLLEIDNQIIPVLLSEDAGSPINVDGKNLRRLDPYTRSKLILFTMLTNTEDGKRENYAIRENARGFDDIFSVDNDQGLVEATTDTYDWLIHKTKKLSVKSLLFCLDAMTDPLDGTAVQEFLTLNPIDTLKAWLKDLSQLEEHYDLLFNECKEKSATEKDLLKRSYLQIVLPVATLLRIAYKLELLQKTLKSCPEISSLKLLHIVEPIVANYYAPVLQKTSSATERFDELVKNEGLYRYSEKTKSYSTTITSSRAVFESLVPDNLPDAVTPSLALEIFEEIAQQWGSLNLEQVRVLQGEIDRFSQLHVTKQENVLKLMRLNQLSSLQRSMLLKAVCKRTDFNELYLCYPEASLTNGGLIFSSFELLLHNNSGLECLSITQATALTAVPLLNSLKSLKKLELIQLPKLKEISASLPMLTDLVIKANSQLTTLTLDAPQLRRLRIIDCPNLQTLNLPKSMALDDVIIQGCNQIPLADFYSIWPGFISRWHEEPLGFCKKLADYIVQSFSEIKFVNTKSVYDCVTTYLKKIIKVRELLTSQERAEHYSFLQDDEYYVGTQEFYSAYILAHLHYDHPLVMKNLMRCFPYFYELDISFEYKLDHIKMLISAFYTLQKLNDPLVNQPILKWLDMEPGKSAVQKGCGCEKCKKNLERINDTAMTVGRRKTVQYAIIDELVNLQVTDQWYIGWLTHQSKRGGKFAHALDFLQKDKVFFPKKELFKLPISVELLFKKYAININSDEILVYIKNRASANFSTDLRIATAKALVVHYQFENLLKPEFEQIKHSVFIEPRSSEKKVGSSPLLTEPLKIDESIKNIPLISAAEKGDLAVIKKLLRLKSIKQPTHKNLINRILSLAANKGYFPIVAYLIKHYYVGSTLSEHEKLVSLTEDKIRYYLNLFHLCSQKPSNKQAILSLLKEISKHFNPDDCSDFYLLYLWMQVHHQAQTPLSKFEPMNDEPAVYQLLSEHQSELILHMIRQGYVLKNWYINTDELSITDMAFDKRQVNALEQLLEQSEYRFCLKLPNSVIENNRIYLELNEQGALQYTVRDFNGKIRVGLISCGELGCELTVPLTLDQLESLPNILEQISNSGYLRPKFQTLIFNNVRFTKEYRIRAIPRDCIIEKNTLYVQTTNDCIEYTVITPSGKKITDTISGDMLRKKGLKFEFQAASIIFPPRFKQLLSGILEITTERGHTTAENTTKGYKEFLKLLKNPVLITKLHSLYLQSCDLSDDYDLDALYPVLVQRTALRYLNLDTNHVTRQGLLNLLEVFKTAEPQSRLETLSLCFNKIQIDSLKQLDELTLKARGLTALHLEGNMIVEDPKEDDIFKKEHKKRKYALGKLLPLLAEKEPGLTIDSFISATHISLSEEEHHLRLKLNDANGNEREIEITLDAQDFDFYDQLRMNEIDKTERDYSEILPYIKAGINPTNTPKWLRNLPLPQKSAPIVEQKEVSKQLLNYHRDALLKGRLTRHSFFRSEKIAEQPSMLFPDTRLTLEEGRVYLIANNKDWDGEHVRLAYEYITGYGQRIFRIAHLFLNKGELPVVAFDDHNLEKRIPWLLRDHLIATFSATTKNIKTMHRAIKKDVALGDKLPIHYFAVISGSSKNKSVMNCLTYCLIKMEESLKNIIIPMGLTDVFPSTVVKKCIEIERAIESETLGLSS